MSPVASSGHKSSHTSINNLFADGLQPETIAVVYWGVGFVNTD